MILTVQQRMCELVSSAYNDSFLKKDSQTLLASVRAGNVIGGDWAKDRLIPDAIRSFFNNSPVPIRNPKSTRRSLF